MRNQSLFQSSAEGTASSQFQFGGRSASGPGRALASAVSTPRQGVIGILLVVALFAFELFNFDTTRFALGDLLGDVNFVGIPWAAILAVAFCAIDFAGLAHLLTPDQGRDEPKEVWYLMGAWLLGATMNAVMTWWAVNLTLLNHQFGNEVLSREQLLHVVPPFVAVLVWLTRILFIGAFSVAGEHFFESERPARLPSSRPLILGSGLSGTPERSLPSAIGAQTTLPLQENARRPMRTTRRPPLPSRGQPAPAARMSGRE